jgi:coenzyme F420 hydrogenase subunit beta
MLLLRLDNPSRLFQGSINVVHIVLKHGTIEQVVEKGLCTGCGTCISICPSRSIGLLRDKKSQGYVPSVNTMTCKGCQLCLKVCPGHNVDFEQLNRQFLGRQVPINTLNILLGNYLNCYTGYSTDSKIRFDSSSGGMVTQLLVFALEEGIIDGALVTRMKKDNPLEPELAIARTKDEILEASKSKYCPVPANIALREILEKDGKYAVVGLPCHLHGVRKAEQFNKTLRDRIILHFGLVCTHNDSFLQIDYLLQKYGLKYSDLAEIIFRGKGWPGVLTFKLRSGSEVNYPFRDWVGIHEQCFFTPSRCLVCCDQSAELADLSFGDAWLPEFSDDKLGTSVLISRTRVGEELLLKAKLNNRVELDEISAIKMAKSQGMMRFKKNGLGVRVKLFKLTGKNIPVYSAMILKPGFIDYPRSCMIFVNQYLASKRSLWLTLEPLISMQDFLKQAYLKMLDHL